MPADVIQLADRRRKPAEVTADQHQETVMELAVRNAESLMAFRRVQSHAMAALHALATAGVSVPLAEHHVSQALRLSVQELRRATATDPEPIQMRRAA